MAQVVLDVEFEEVTIAPGEGSLGSITSPSVMRWEGKDRRAVARANIVSTYGGAEAERAVFGEVWEPGIGHDEQQAFWLSRTYGVFPRRLQAVGSEQHWRYLEKLRREARRLTQRYRPQVLQVAELLMKRTTLSQKAVLRLLGWRN